MGKYLDNLVQELEEMKVDNMVRDAESARFTLTLSLDQMRRLEYFCKYFGVKRASFSADLLVGAIAEIESKFKVSVDDYINHIENKTELTEMQKEYFNDVLRLGKLDTHIFRDGNLIIKDSNGNIIKSDFTEEVGENHE
jgi:intein-encoded DNA endonuclease-like protein